MGNSPGWRRGGLTEDTGALILQVLPPLLTKRITLISVHPAEGEQRLTPQWAPQSSALWALAVTSVEGQPPHSPRLPHNQAQLQDLALDRIRDLFQRQDFRAQSTAPPAPSPR